MDQVLNKISRWFSDMNDKVAGNNIIQKLNEWIEPARDWLYANHNNPVVWGAFFLIGLFIFGIVYRTLSKN